MRALTWQRLRARGAAKNEPDKKEASYFYRADLASFPLISRASSSSIICLCCLGSRGARIIISFPLAS
jgi:hypothetical protein